MTSTDVAHAKAVLKAQGKEVTVQAIQQYLGRGEKRAISRLLNQIARAEAERAHPAPPPQRPRYAGRHFDLRRPAADRKHEAAHLDTFIAARRAQGLGARTAPQASPLQDEDAETFTKEARGKQRTLTLRDSLLAEVVPWLVRKGGP
jgi:Plasmid replication region DNA-binding N-term